MVAVAPVRSPASSLPPHGCIWYLSQWLPPRPGGAFRWVLSDLLSHHPPPGFSPPGAMTSSVFLEQAGTLLPKGPSLACLLPGVSLLQILPRLIPFPASGLCSEGIPSVRPGSSNHDCSLPEHSSTTDPPRPVPFLICTASHLSHNLHIYQVFIYCLSSLPECKLGELRGMIYSATHLKGLEHFLARMSSGSTCDT